MIAKCCDEVHTLDLKYYLSEINLSAFKTSVAKGREDGEEPQQ